jgi:hypothetical protein
MWMPDFPKYVRELNRVGNIMLRFLNFSTKLTWVIFLFATHLIFAQVENMTYRGAIWHPIDDIIAFSNTNPLLNNIEITNAQLEHIISLELVGINDIDYIDIITVKWNLNGDKIAGTFDVWSTTNPVTSYIGIWEYQTWTQILLVPDSGFEFAWSPTGNYIATDKKLIQVPSGNIIRQYSTYNIYDIEWNPINEEQLLFNDGSAYIQNAFTGEIIYDNVVKGVITRPVFSPNGFYLATASVDDNDNTIIDIYDTTYYQIVNSIILENSIIDQKKGLTWFTNEIFVVNALDTTWLGDITNNDFIPYIDLEVDAWSNQGLKFLSSTNDIGENNIIAVFDAETEGILVQISREGLPTVRSLSLIDNTTALLSSPLIGDNGNTNKILLSEVAAYLIQASTSPDEVGSVQFSLDGVISVDNTAPYTFDLPTTAGIYSLTATPFTSVDATGEFGLAFTVIIEIVGNSP